MSDVPANSMGDAATTAIKGEDSVGRLKKMVRRRLTKAVCRKSG